MTSGLQSTGSAFIAATARGLNFSPPCVTHVFESHDGSVPVLSDTVFFLGHLLTGIHLFL